MQQTNQGKSGGLLKGDRHSDKSGGIKAVVTDDKNKPVLLESGEVIINREAVKKYWKELNRINTSTGGKPIHNPISVSAKLGGKITKESKLKNNNNQKITKDEIRNVISGTVEFSKSATIIAALRYIESGEKERSTEKNKAIDIKSRQSDELKVYALKNNLIFNTNNLPTLFDKGVEQSVYLIDEKNVVKINNLNYYNSWTEYFRNLLLHNYFFPQDSYQLIGFCENKNSFCAVVKQPFVDTKEVTDIKDVRKFLCENGFVAERNNRYFNDDIGVDLNDLHDENVLTKNGILRFVDTVFYLNHSFQNTKHNTAQEKTKQKEHISSITFSMKNFDKQKVFEWLKKNNFNTKDTDILEHMTVYEFLNNSKKPIDKKTKQIVNIENGVKAICFNFKK